jgi:hypothetical protein
MSEKKNACLHCSYVPCSADSSYCCVYGVVFFQCEISSCCTVCRTDHSKSSLTGNGTARGKMDAPHGQGCRSSRLLDSGKVANDKNNVVVAMPAGKDAEATIWGQLLCLRLLQNKFVRQAFGKVQENQESSRNFTKFVVEETILLFCVCSVHKLRSLVVCGVCRTVTSSLKDPKILRCVVKP